MTRSAARSFTVQEQRAFRLERWSLSVQLAVAVIAAVISFQALRDAGLRMGLNWAAPLLPLAIDGFAVIASLGIIRSQGTGERFGARASEWLGLCFVLGLSIAAMSPTPWTRWTRTSRASSPVCFGSAPPLIVAYGIHVYGRAMTSGVSRHVLVDEPDKIHFGLTHLGERDTVRTPGSKRATVQSPERAAAQATIRAAVQETDQTPGRVSGGRYPRDSERQRAFEVWKGLYAGQPVNAKKVLRTAKATKDESTVRRWCRAWEREAHVGLVGHETTAASDASSGSHAEESKAH